MSKAKTADSLAPASAPAPSSTVRVPAALRTVQLLQTLGRASAPMTAQAIAQRLNIPRSSTYQLLEILESQGFVLHFPEDKRWSLGVAALELGTAYLRHDPLERLAQPILNRLLQQVGAFTADGFAAVGQLGILSGSELLYLLKGTTLAHAQANLAVVTDVGVRLPAHLTASGRSMLALLDKAQFRATYPGGNDTTLATRTLLGPGTNRDLLALLTAERELGYSTEVDQVTAGYASVAASSRNHLGLPVAAFAVTFRTERMDPDQVQAIVSRLAQLVRQSAGELTRRMGAK